MVSKLHHLDSGAHIRRPTDHRTIMVGESTAEMRGPLHPGVEWPYRPGTARFPIAHRHAADSFARRPCGKRGWITTTDTGHAWGAYLRYMRGRKNISKAGAAALKARHGLFQEPGLLQSRRLRPTNPHQNLGDVVVRSRMWARNQMMSFETITLAPIGLNLVDRHC